MLYSPSARLAVLKDALNADAVVLLIAVQAVTFPLALLKR